LSNRLPAAEYNASSSKWQEKSFQNNLFFKADENEAPGMISGWRGGALAGQFG
jgi:hypothetical protein